MVKPAVVEARLIIVTIILKLIVMDLALASEHLFLEINFRIMILVICYKSENNSKLLNEVIVLEHDLKR